MKRILLCLALLGGVALKAASTMPMPSTINTNRVYSCLEDGTCTKCVAGTKDMFHDDDQWDLRFEEETDE